MSDSVLFLAEEKKNEDGRKIRKETEKKLLREKCIPEQFYTSSLMTPGNVCVII